MPRYAKYGLQIIPESADVGVNFKVNIFRWNLGRFMNMQPTKPVTNVIHYNPRAATPSPYILFKMHLFLPKRQLINKTTYLGLSGHVVILCP